MAGYSQMVTVSGLTGTITYSDDYLPPGLSLNKNTARLPAHLLSGRLYLHDSRVQQ